MAHPDEETFTGEEEFEEVGETQDQGDDLGDAAQYAVDKEGEPLGEAPPPGQPASAAPAKEAPWTPPGREEWDRLHRERDGFKREMVENRTGLKQLAERVQPFIDYYEQARKIDEAIAKDAKEKIPDPTEDGIGHVIGRVGQMIRPVAEAVTQLQTAREQEQESQMFESWREGMKAEADADISRAQEEHPDWNQAMGHLANTMMAPLIERVGEEEARAIFSAELNAVVKQCKEAGVSPADHFFLMAQQLGWRGGAAPAPATGNGARTAGRLTAQRHANESMTGIAAVRGSGSAAKLMPSAKDMASMSTDEWAEAIDRYGIDTLMAQLAEETAEA